jgi:hypothetical protein
MSGKASVLCGLSSAALLALGLAAAHAADKLNGAQIRAAVSGNTVQGMMEGTGAYAEFYQNDGVIRGDGYTGVWAIEGDAMCFQYGSDPKACWEVIKDGDLIQWLKDGKVEGSGTVAPGNPNNF